MSKMKPFKKPKPKPKRPVAGDALFRLELRQIYQIRLLRRIDRKLSKFTNGNPAESQAMKDQVQKMIDSTIEQTTKLKDAVPPQE